MNFKKIISNLDILDQTTLTNIRDDLANHIKEANLIAGYYSFLVIKDSKQAVKGCLRRLLKNYETFNKIKPILDQIETWQK